MTNGLGVSPSSTHIPRYDGGVVLNQYRFGFLALLRYWLA